MVSERLRKFRLRRAEQRAAKKPRLPPIAAKADDLEAIKKSVEDAAAVGAPLWLSYLFLLFYIAIAASAVTHADLLLENPVELPFLTIKLALKAFFILAPVLFLITHAYIMAHFALLADKARRFNEQLRKKIDGAREKTHEIREGLRRQLPINLFVQFLVGPEDIREGPFSALLWLVAWATLVAGPVLVLLLFELQFLPYHDSRITWWHRVLLICDLTLIWWLWMRILSGRSKQETGEKAVAVRWARFKDGFLWWSRNFVAWPLTGAIVFFSVFVATFPSEWGAWPLSFVASLEPKAANRLVFGQTDPRTHVVTGNVLWNTLHLREFDIYEAFKLDDPKKLDWKEHTYGLQDRRLEGADFRFAKFGKVDLRGAHLEGASLDSAKLQGATLDRAWLQGATLDRASLQGASLKGAHLEGASLDGAKLQGALLACEPWIGDTECTQLQGASLDWVELQGAWLEGAQLQGASLQCGPLVVSDGCSQLQGASLGWAELQGASLDGAQLQGASLDSASLQGASLGGTHLQTASLENTKFWRADLKGLDTASLKPIRFSGTWGPEVGVDLYKMAITWWDQQKYAELRREMGSIPAGGNKRQAFERIARLSCKISDKTLASCDRKAEPPFIVRDWQVMLNSANVDDRTYKKALAKTLRALICDGNADAIHILRGVTTNSRLADTGSEAPALIDHIMGSSCPTSAALTEADKERLQEIKKNAQKRFPPAAPTKTPKQPASAASGGGRSSAITRRMSANR